MIIITGATGELGRLIVGALIKRVSVDNVGVSVRDPHKAADIAKLGVRVRHGDFENADSLRHAFEGASQVLIVSSNARASGGDPLAQHRNAIEAAQAVGAGRIVYTSHMAASPTSAFPPARDHAATERMLADARLAWTALRHGFYAESGLMMHDAGLKAGLIEAPADGKVSWTTHADLADADAAILADEGRFDGPTPPLTAPDAIDLDDLAAIAAEVLGRPVDRRVVTDEHFKMKMVARGAPDGAVAMAQGLYIAAREGEFATIDPTLASLLDRDPTTMRALIVQTATRWAA